MSIAMVLPEDGNVIACDITDEYLNIGKPLWKEVSDIYTGYNAFQYVRMLFHS